MNKTEISLLENEELLIAFYWLAVRTTNEENSRRGVTKKTFKEEGLILEEMHKRFGIDIEKLKQGVIK